MVDTPIDAHSFSRRALLLAGTGTALTAVATPRADAAPARQSSLARWNGSFPGTHRGTAVAAGALVLARTNTTGTYTDPHTRRRIAQDISVWTSSVTVTRFPAKELIVSWNAATPVGTAVRVRLRARTTGGRWSKWFTMALWASSSAGPTAPTRSTIAGQSDAIARIATDTLVARSGLALDAFQLRLELLRPKGSRLTPKVTQAAVVASSSATSSTPVSAVGPGRGKVLAVPSHSQMLHVGHYPQWNGGGEAWCSAASTAMVLDYWKLGASAAETAWVRPRPHVGAQVEQVVRGVWDASFRGTGNWPFNVAYASARGMQGFVTRLASLADAERFIAAGIPLVVSTSFSRSQLTGAGFGTNGHLMVVRGFDSRGNVRVNDPASGMRASNALVPRTYDRAQFESAWGRTGGTTYVMYPKGRALPGRPGGLPRW